MILLHLSFSFFCIFRNSVVYGCKNDTPLVFLFLFSHFSFYSRSHNTLSTQKFLSSFFWKMDNAEEYDFQSVLGDDYIDDELPFSNSSRFSISKYRYLHMCQVKYYLLLIINDSWDIIPISFSNFIISVSTQSLILLINNKL